MENPALLNEKTLEELKEILDEFPYFQTAHLLYTRNLMNEKNFRFANQLKICALHATDRKVLYHLLNPVRTWEGLSGEASASVTGLKESFSPGADEKILPHQTIPSAVQSIDQVEPSYRLEGTDVESDKPLGQLVKEINEAADKHLKDKKPGTGENLIDRFLKENPPVSRTVSISQEVTDDEDDQDDSSNENDEFITETLAKIYIKQGLYQKAINAFQKLTLKYPEKSIYFARQIEEITKLLNK